MRKPIILFIFIFLALFLNGCSSEPPQINLETNAFDFGDLANGVVIEKDLTIRNTGGTDLIIEAIITSCDCTNAELDSTRIPADDSATLHITFDSGTYGPELSGKVMRKVILVSNDPENSEALITFVANILPQQE
jgi:hypothetical protein